MNRLFCISAIAAAAMLTACQTKEQKEEYNMAAQIGAQHAREVGALIETGDTLQTQDLLIEIASRESEIRRRGAAKVADAYHRAFMLTLDSINPGVAAELEEAAAAR